mmetsp:Transcript_34558/g.91779  ORF Transcript_34558/g.91779 Transcript_34558/m.91779 type:complete len:260 (+) Transcript_34558:2365-3144(+)
MRGPVTEQGVRQPLEYEHHVHDQRERVEGVKPTVEEFNVRSLDIEAGDKVEEPAHKRNYLQRVECSFRVFAHRVLVRTCEIHPVVEEGAHEHENRHRRQHEDVDARLHVAFQALLHALDFMRPLRPLRPRASKPHHPVLLMLRNGAVDTLLRGERRFCQKARQGLYGAVRAVGARHHSTLVAGGILGRTLRLLDQLALPNICASLHDHPLLDFLLVKDIGERNLSLRDEVALGENVFVPNLDMEACRFDLFVRQICLHL